MRKKIKMRIIVWRWEKKKNNNKIYMGKVYVIWVVIIFLRWKKNNLNIRYIYKG